MDIEYPCVRKCIVCLNPLAILKTLVTHVSLCIDAVL